MTKAAFFDIDGTLLSFKTHQVSTGTIEAFKALRDKGIKTFISSGRPTRLIPEFPFGFDGHITMNGGRCYTLENGSQHVLLANPLPQDTSRKWLDHAKSNNITTFAFTADAIFVNRLAPDALELQAQLGFPMPPVRPTDELYDEVVFQFIAMQPADADADLLKMLPDCRLPRWHHAFSDLIPASNSKAEGIRHILDHYGIQREECIGFGDGDNDIEMLEYCGIGVAMGNAADSVKSHADYVTTDVDNEGIRQGLLHFGII